jgi:hypothetical protein
MRRDAIAVAIVILAAALVLTLTSTSQNSEYFGSLFSNTAKTLTNQFVDSAGDALSANTKQSLGAISKMNSAKAADEFRKLPISELNSIRNGSNQAAKDALQALEVKYFGKKLDTAGPKFIPDSIPKEAVGRLTYDQIADLPPPTFGKVVAAFQRMNLIDDVFQLQLRAQQLGKNLDAHIFVRNSDGVLEAKPVGAGYVKDGVAIDNYMKNGINNAAGNKKAMQAFLKDLGIVNRFHLEDVARVAKIPDDVLNKALKQLPRTRSLLSAITGKPPFPSEAAYKEAMEKAGKSSDAKPWYKDWKAQGGIAFAIVAGLAIPLAQWFWPNPNGSGGGSSKTCDGLCELLNNPDTAVMIGGASWLSLSCCCCICCLLVIAMMGGGKKANNNFF